MKRYYASPAYDGGYYIADRDNHSLLPKNYNEQKNPGRLQYELDKLNGDLFPMQDGPDIPWWMGEMIYDELYAKTSPGSAAHQNLAKIAERGGFGWDEVHYMWRDLKKRKFKYTADELEAKLDSLVPPDEGIIAT